MNSLPNIVFLDAYTLNPGDLSWDPFENLGIVKIFNRSNTEEGIQRAMTAEIIVVNKFEVSEAFLKECPNIKFICVAATGYNNIDLEATRKRGISVSNVVGYSTSGVAQHTFALILNILNKVSKHNTSVKKGFWSVSPDFSYTISPIRELAGKTLGLLGYGNIAKAVAKIGLAFNMKVIAHSRSKTKGQDDLVQFVKKEELLSSSDILSLHAALNEGTIDFINKESLAKMKSSAILVNTGRGGLINEHDLAQALEHELIHAAALDVMQSEPAELSHPLFNLANCIITPHVSWASVESRTRLMDLVVENIRAYMNGAQLNIVL